MNFLSLFHPFGRIGRLGFIVLLPVVLAAVFGGLHLLRFGGDLSFFGLLIFCVAAWFLFALMVNRTRDAEASAGWVLTPLLISGLSIFAIVKIGYIDFSDFILPGDTRAERIVSAPLRPLIMIVSAFVPILIAMAVSSFFWLLSFIALAVFPSRVFGR